MDKEEFVKGVNDMRKANKDKWYMWKGEVRGTLIRLKGFNTWIQRIEIGAITDSGPMDCSVKSFKEYLFDCVS